MIRKGSKFMITRRSHWGFGRVFTCTGIPSLRVRGNPDMADLVWHNGELIEFEHYDHSNKRWPYLIRADWCREVNGKE